MGLFVAACSSTLPILEPTSSPASTATLTPTPTSLPTFTFTPAPACVLFDPLFAERYTPRAADRAGWCEVEYSDFTISFPNQWAVGSVGAWGQNLQFRLQGASGSSAHIDLIGSTTELPVEQADQTILVTHDGDQTFRDPIVDPAETIGARNLQTIGDVPVLVLTTRRGEDTIRRYFWWSKEPYWLNKRAFLIFEFEVPISDFENPASQATLQELEEVIAMVRPTPTCADGFTRLHTNMYAQVTAGGVPNRVRSGPGTGSEVEAQIYSGTILYLGDGPVCADGMVFWYVFNAGIPGGGGWTAEGDFSEYYLEPYVP